jgi:hypothetical protein
MVPAFFLQEDGLMLLGGILHFEKKSTDTFLKKKKSPANKTIKAILFIRFCFYACKIY